MLTLDPVQELELLEEEMTDLLGGVHVYPLVNVWSNETEAVLTAELPGVEAKDLEISVMGDALALCGTRQSQELKENEQYHRRERLAGKFARSLVLPFKVNADKVAAKLQHGILTVTLPRAEEDKPRKISLKPE
jgi:HSP20 family protein